MKTTKKILSIALTFVIIFMCVSMRVSATENISDSAEATAKYIESVLSRYLRIDDSISYGKVELSDPVKVVNSTDPNGEIYFIKNNGSYIGRLAVTQVNGKNYSSFMFDNDRDIANIIESEIPFVLVSSEDTLIMKTNSQCKTLSGSIIDAREKTLEAGLTFSAIDFEQINFKDSTASVASSDYYVSLNVQRVENATAGGKGLCWAASIAAVSNYRKGTSYSALDIYNALKNAYGGTPIGDDTWYRRGFGYCNMSCVFSPNNMQFSSLYTALRTHNRPVIFNVYRTNNNGEVEGGHAVVLKYLCGGNEYTTYGFADPNNSNTVYINFEDPNCDPDNFVYYNGHNTYTIWASSVY